MISVCLWLEAFAAPLQTIGAFGENPGNLEMLVYFPDGLPQDAALVVVPHGCFQTVEYLVEHSGWLEIADQYKFALLFPKTNRDNEPFGACFRTWQPDHQQRSKGEPLSVQQMVQWLLENRSLDSDRVFIAGMSSGGLMASVMLATYPELFNAGAAASAYPYKCATEFEELAPCSQAQQLPGHEGLGALVVDASPGHEGARPRVSLWHGADDALIVPANLELQLRQWSEAMGVQLNDYQQSVVNGHERKTYRDSEGQVVLETWLLKDTSHAIAVSLQFPPTCGKVGDYFEDSGICTAYWTANWFGITD